MKYYSGKKWHLAICSNMDWTGDHYAKWNKTNIERQIQQGLACMWNLKMLIW